MLKVAFLAAAVLLADMFPRNACGGLCCSGPSRPIVLSDDPPDWTRRPPGPCPNLPEFEVFATETCAVGVAHEVRSYSQGLTDATREARRAIAALAVDPASALVPITFFDKQQRRMYALAMSNPDRRDGGSTPQTSEAADGPR
jgi:hypothetical protein